MTLLAFYRNDGIDRSGNGHNLTAGGTPGTTIGLGGVANAAMLLDADVGNNYSLLGQIVPVAVPFTIAGFCKCIASGPFTMLHQDASGQDVFCIKISQPTGIATWVIDHAAKQIAVASNPGHAFHHYAGTWDGVTSRFYIDGAEAGNAAFIPSTGMGVFALGPGDFGQAALQYVGVYDAALSAPQVSELYNGGLGLDPTITYALQAETSQPARVPTLARPSRIPTLAVLPRV